ncbi:MAG: AAA family ATPase, partial [Candidatus Nitrosocosmicus sp.]
KITLCDYAKYLLFVRDDEKFFPHFYASKLFQQWLVDTYAKVEWDRLEYIRTHQTEICRSNYTNVEDFLKNLAAKKSAEIKKKIILPSTFTGGPRNMHEHFMNAMSIVSETGKPDLFITFTCNPKDPDILKCLKENQTPSDRPEIISRVFKLKKEHLLYLIIEKKIFGTVIGNVWTIEYQKRGLPHLHLLVTLAPAHKKKTVEEINKIICAELPNEKEEPELYKIVSNCMMHGPCSEKAPCWDKVKQKCSKRFPKAFSDTTVLNDDGYPQYMRRNDGKFVEKHGKTLSNQFVVPYNPYLSKTFGAHINVERVAEISAVKYIYDYIYKGYDAATIECAVFDENGQKTILKYDEVSKYLEARYLSPCEAAWKIFKYPMQGKSHSVDVLDIHLENQQNIFYKKNASQEEIEEASKKDTTLTAYFKFCQKYPNLNILYKDMPKHCTWKEKKWKYPREGYTKKLGRIYPVNPTETEKYYLRYLLLNTKGTSFDDLKTYNGIKYDTYAKACLARGLIKDDEEWHKCMEEACMFSRKHPKGLRVLFVNILLHCAPKYPENIWEAFKDHMVSDLKRQTPNLPAHIIYQKGLNLIEKILNYQEKSLNDFPSMPKADNTLHFIDDEELFDSKEEKKIADEFKNKMNLQQKEILEELTKSFKNNEQKLFFIDGPGGTGKSFTLTALFHEARANGKKVCNMAFSGVAATNLKKGRTLHNRFKLPLNIKKNSTSGIELGSKESEEIKSIDIFIWDEAPMASRFVLEMVDNKLKEIMKNKLPFGGKTLILSGDFRQILPIKEFGTRSEVINLLIKNSFLWPFFKKLKLFKNMRADPKEVDFANELIKIGDGIAGTNNYLTLPDYCYSNGNLIEEIFGDLKNCSNFEELCEKAILAPYNSIVDKYNENIIELFPGEPVEYLSIDETEIANNFHVPLEILNSLKCTSLPNHKLIVKKNSMVMLIRNLNVKEGLCNGTRLQVIDAGKHVLNCMIKNGDKKGEMTLIPRITLIEDKKYPFILKRHQYPLKTAFAFTINKAQSQTFSKIGIDYTEPPFAHGHTYVAFSRARGWHNIKVKLNEADEKKVKNIVWEEVLK